MLIEKKQKYVWIMLVCCLMLTLLVGCDIKDKEKKAIVKELKNQEALQIGDKGFKDYSKTYTESNGPVPGSTRYYDYDIDGGTVQVRFYGWKEDGKQYYGAQLREQTDDTNYSTSYTFQKKVTGNMKLVNRSVISLEKTFGANQRYGITRIYYRGSQVVLYLKKDNSKVVNKALYDMWEEGNKKPEQAQKVICDINGNVHEAESTKYKEKTDVYVISANLAKGVEGDLVSWQLGNIILDVKNKKVVSANSVY